MCRMKKKVMKGMKVMRVTKMTKMMMMMKCSSGKQSSSTIQHYVIAAVYMVGVSRDNHLTISIIEVQVRVRNKKVCPSRDEQHVSLDPVRLMHHPLR